VESSQQKSIFFTLYKVNHFHKNSNIGSAIAKNDESNEAALHQRGIIQYQ
jgi:hypothetical protein